MQRFLSTLLQRLAIIYLGAGYFFSSMLIIEQCLGKKGLEVSPMW